jgi:hypothetical protein
MQKEDVGETLSHSRIFNKLLILPLSKTGTQACRSFLSIEMILLARLTVKYLMGPQLKHTLVAGKKLRSVNKHLGSSSAMLFADHTVHERLSYRNRIIQSNPIKRSYEQGKGPGYLMVRFNSRL